jgi:hypothetical protein
MKSKASSFKAVVASIFRLPRNGPRVFRDDTTIKSTRRAGEELGSGARSQEKTSRESERTSRESTFKDTWNWGNATIKQPEAAATAVVHTRAEAG